LEISGCKKTQKTLQKHATNIHDGLFFNNEKTQKGTKKFMERTTHG